MFESLLSPWSWPALWLTRPPSISLQEDKCWDACSPNQNHRQAFFHIHAGICSGARPLPLWDVCSVSTDSHKGILRDACLPWRDSVCRARRMEARRNSGSRGKARRCALLTNHFECFRAQMRCVSHEYLTSILYVNMSHMFIHSNSPLCKYKRERYNSPGTCLRLQVSCM